jgi:hypothetical protein
MRAKRVYLSEEAKNENIYKASACMEMFFAQLVKIFLIGAGLNILVCSDSQHISICMSKTDDQSRNFHVFYYSVFGY